MSVFSCLKQPPPSAESLIIADGLFNIVAPFLLVSVALIASGALLIRRAYRNRVTRLMCLNQVQSRPTAWWTANSPATSQNSTANTVEECDIVTLQAQAASRERRIATATAAGWIAFVLSGILITKWLLPGSGWPGQVNYALLAGALVLFPLSINLPIRFKRKTIITVLIALAVAIGALDSFGEIDSTDDEPFEWGDLIVSLILLVFLVQIFHRRFRGLVLPSVLVVTVFVLTFLIPIALLEGHVGSCFSGLNDGGDLATNISQRQFWSASAAFIGATMAALGIWLGFQAVGLMAHMIERGWLGDLSMLTVIGMTLVTVAMVFGAMEDGAEYTTAMAWAPLIWLLPPISVYVLVLGKRPQSGPGHDLLILRVFSKDRAQQALLEQVQARWRYLGAVNQAGGPDLVDLNVDAYECSMFLSSRLHDLYLPAALNAEQLAARFNNLPDREGRYRINEMFNFNTAWRENVEQLLLLSKTILLDLRGLTVEREGTSFEIGLLARNNLLNRVVAFGDNQTDWSHIGRQLSQAGQSLDRLKRLDDDMNIDELFIELLKVATRQQDLTTAPTTN